MTDAQLLELIDGCTIRVIDAVKHLMRERTDARDAVARLTSAMRDIERLCLAGRTIQGQVIHGIAFDALRAEENEGVGK